MNKKRSDGFKAFRLIYLKKKDYDQSCSYNVRVLPQKKKLDTLHYRDYKTCHVSIFQYIKCFITVIKQ